MLVTRLVRLACLSALCCGVAAGAQAQNPEEGDTGAGLSTGFSASADSNTGTSGSAYAAPTATGDNNLADDADDDADGPVGDSDHDKVVGTFGVGFFGLEQLPLYRQTCAGGVCQHNAGDYLTAPMIGGRFWLSDLLGIEAAIGLAIESNSAETTSGTTTVSGDRSGFGLGLHGGVPLALVDMGHFVFEVVPQLNLGFTSGSASSVNGDIDSSGFLLQAGATVGSEIHFGFMDLPQLALQANIGLLISFESWSQDGTGDMPPSYSDSQTSVRTFSGQDPWEILIGNISAIYYF